MPPHISLHLLSVVPYLAGQPQRFPFASLCLPSFVRLPPLRHPRPAPRSLSASGVIQSEGPFIPLPASVACTSASPPARFYRWPSPLPFTKGLWHVLLSPTPCSSSSHYLCSAPYIGDFWILIYIWVTFCARARSQGASNLWLFLYHTLSSALLCYAVSVRIPPVPPSLCLPLLRVIPSLLVEGSGV